MLLIAPVLVANNLHLGPFDFIFGVLTYLSLYCHAPGFLLIGHWFPTQEKVQCWAEKDSGGVCMELIVYKGPDKSGTAPLHTHIQSSIHSNARKLLKSQEEAKLKSQPTLPFTNAATAAAAAYKSKCHRMWSLVSAVDMLVVIQFHNVDLTPIQLHIGNRFPMSLLN